MHKTPIHEIHLKITNARYIGAMDISSVRNCVRNFKELPKFLQKFKWEILNILPADRKWLFTKMNDFLSGGRFLSDYDLNEGV